MKKYHSTAELVIGQSYYLDRKKIVIGKYVKKNRDRLVFLCTSPETLTEYGDYIYFNINFLNNSTRWRIVRREYSFVKLILITTSVCIMLVALLYLLARNDFISIKQQIYYSITLVFSPVLLFLIVKKNSR